MINLRTTSFIKEWTMPYSPFRIFLQNYFVHDRSEEMEVVK